MAERRSGRVAARKNIGTEVYPSDLVAESLLEEGPPFSLEQGLIGEPIRDGLLCDGRVPDLAESGSKSSLATSSDVNSALQRGNVSFLHDHAKYTNAFVNATTPFVLHQNKEACNVLTMPTQARKQAISQPIRSPKRRTPRREARAGKDGKTLGQRVTEAMAYESGRRRGEYRQVDLLRDVNRIAGRSDDDPLLTQQMLSAIMRGTVSRSSVTQYIAAACHVSPFWLSDGAGKMQLE